MNEWHLSELIVLPPLDIRARHAKTIPESTINEEVFAVVKS